MLSENPKHLHYGSCFTANRNSLAAGKLSRSDASYATVILRLCVFALEIENQLHRKSVMKSVHVLFLTIFFVSRTIRAEGSTDSGQSESSRKDCQPTSVEVGDAKLTGSQLRPYTNLWAMSQQKPGGTSEKVGTWSDSLETTNYEGRPAMKRTQIAKYDKKGIQLTFVSIFDPKTMAPFSFDYARSDNGNIRHVEFRQEHVTYRHTYSSDSKPAEATAKLDRQVFDFYGGMYGVLISTLPLTEGYTATIPALDTNTMAIDWIPVHVKGRETVAAGAGEQAETWVVETPTKLYGRMTWWVRKEPPYVIKAVLEVPEKEDGSGRVAAIITYTMV